ncbi:hypothetical protein WSK_2074 [Novosphingobium sp. Rr 2-17]|uniref:hypothetical protein n=1 Tax=Novosphingobium sp. Rr 2-17 TaxID=555793 RepID=UPI0002698894|nr:hypothetical protein [Novosphingobium sp. Rr 2-17]EIZ79229.1 hypothetical protein WSK_2074 [Novosphingobium sp. Rr 2-17]
MSFFDEMQALALDFAAGEMFTDATITRAASGQSYNQVMGEYEDVATDIIGCRAVSEDVRSRAADGRLVFSTVITLNVEPKINDQITIGSRTFVVASISTIAPNGTAILYSATVN